MKVSDVLTNEHRWTKGKSARAADGTPRISLDEGAVCWCLLGAMRKANPILKLGKDAQEVLRRINEMGGWPLERYNGVAHFNDHPETTFAMVQRVIKELDL